MKKGQGAMEYLMTYGWAILVVLIVGVVLWKTGLFGTSATGQSGFDVLVPAEWKVTDGATSNSTILLRNVAGKTLTNVNITVSKDGGTAVSVNPQDVGIAPGKEQSVSFNASTCTSGTSTKLDVTIAYVTNSITHSDSGVIYADCE